MPVSLSLSRYRELSAPGRALNVFESLELEALEETFGQPLLPNFTMSKPAPKTSKVSVTPPTNTKQLLAPQPGEIIQTGSHRLLEPSKTNREHFDETKLAELLASIKTHGILQPLIVRPNPALSSIANGEAVPNMYEIVAGERRWRCSTKLDLDTVPFIVRNYTDKESLEIQKLENLQREDLDPIEEGKGYRQMMKDFGYTLEDLIVRLNRKKSWIYGRIKLANLCPKATEYWRGGTITESVAIRIARIPSHKGQEKFIEESQLVHVAKRGDTLPDRRAAELIAENFMKQLKGAPFDTKDAELVPAKFHDDPLKPDGAKERVFGGACTDCPLRAGNQPDFDPKAGRADVCLHPACYQAKAEANFAKESKVHVDKGGTAINGVDLRDAFHPPYRADDDGICYSSPLKPGNERLYNVTLPGSKETGCTLAQLAKHLKVPSTLVLHPHTGQTLELFDRRVIHPLAVKAGLAKKDSDGSNESWKAKQKKAAAEARHKAAVKAHLAAAVFGTAPGAGSETALVKLLTYLAESFANDASADQARSMCKRRAIDATAFKNSNGVPQRAALKAAPRQLTTSADLFGFLFELASTPRFEGYSAENPLKGACKFLGMDYAKLEAKAKAALKELAAAKKKPAAKKPAGKVQTPAPKAHPFKQENVEYIGPARKEHVEAAAKAAKKGKKGKHLSAEAKARIVAAVKARWAKVLGKAKSKGKGKGKAVAK